jgi:hypothetical protein
VTRQSWAVGSCVICGRLFAFDPDLVPTYTGEPMCALCIARVNVRRAEIGLPEHHVYPNTYFD